MEFAVQETARYAMVNASASPVDLENYALTKVDDVTGVTFTATSSTSANVNYRTITASYNFTFTMQIVPMSGISLNAVSSVPVSEV